MDKQGKILVVDDELGPREALRIILRDDYDVVTAASGQEARGYFIKSEFDLVIMDIRMPDINGIDLLAEIKKISPETEVVMITAYASVETATHALRYGALDYLIKPFDRASVLKVVQKGLMRRENSRKIKEKLAELQLANKFLEREVEKAYKNIQKHYAETVSSLIAAIDAKDSYTKGHQERMAFFAMVLGRELGISEEEIELIRQASLLHDLGKIGIPEVILTKKGSLTYEEFEIIKKHPLIGAEIISPVKFLKKIVPLVLHHHERYDGKGYPGGVKGQDIPLGARIISIIDAIDAMLSERPYAPPRTIPEVKEQLKENTGRQFDPFLVEVILKLDLLSLYKVTPLSKLKS